MNQQPEVYRSPALAEDTSPLSVGSYLVMLIVSAIPLVGLIMMFVWGFGHSNRNRKNFARASLILTAVGIVIFVLFYSTFAAMPDRPEAAAGGPFPAGERPARSFGKRERRGTPRS